MPQIKKLSEQRLRRIIQDLLQEAFTKEEKEKMMSFAGELEDIQKVLAGLQERILVTVKSMEKSITSLDDKRVVDLLKSTIKSIDKTINQELLLGIRLLEAQTEESMTLEKQPSTSPTGKRLPPPLPTKR